MEAQRQDEGLKRAKKSGLEGAEKAFGPFRKTTHAEGIGQGIQHILIRSLNLQLVDPRLHRCIGGDDRQPFGEKRLFSLVL